MFPDCPPRSTMKNGSCDCGSNFSFIKHSNNKNPLEGKGWGYCKPDEFVPKEERIKARIEQAQQEEPNLTEEELTILTNKIIEEEERNEQDYQMMKKKKHSIRYRPESIFIDKVPVELDERVKRNS